MDKETFISQVLQAEPTLYRVAKSILRRDCDCEDAVQEAILKSYQQLDTLRQAQYFRTWLVRILINECHRLHRVTPRTVAFEEHFSQAGREDAEYTDLYRAIADLPERLRLPLVLHYLEGYSVSELCEILHIPQGTVKSRLFKARKLLKSSLESECAS